MTDSIELAVEKLENSGAGKDLARIHRGIEKESLRINPDGSISQIAHPHALGSALTHPYITTDYSEALLELVTPVCDSVSDTLASLDSLHRFVVANIGPEYLWVTSMPCILHGDDSIPIALYGSSNIGQMKNVYRRGLACRYGRTMQSIAGIHFNFSLDDQFWQHWKEINKSSDQLTDFKSACYFSLLRNFYRVLWAILYLYGASPAVCKTFVAGREHSLDYFGHGTFYSPYSTSLRMGDMGYQSNVQSSINIALDDVDQYCQSLLHATQTIYPEYEALGIKTGNEYQQLNANLLQIENEYYAPVRPKRMARSGEKPTTALLERGVEYIEIRSIDLNPFIPSGIDESSIKFLELLLISCFFKESPSLTPREMHQLGSVQSEIVCNGRNPSMNIPFNGGKKSIKDAGNELVTELRPIAQLLEKSGEQGYQIALDLQMEKFENPELTPSAMMLKTMTEQDISFFQFAMEKSIEHGDFFQRNSLSTEENNKFNSEAENSIHCQEALEAADTQSFEEFLKQYFS
jgi:glutamate--cysteine ligase